MSQTVMQSIEELAQLKRKCANRSAHQCYAVRVSIPTYEKITAISNDKNISRTSIVQALLKYALEQMDKETRNGQ